LQFFLEKPFLTESSTAADVCQSNYIIYIYCCLFLLSAVMPRPASHCCSLSGGSPLAARGGGCSWSATEYPEGVHRIVDSNIDADLSHF
jgi:hypothetical protein